MDPIHRPPFRDAQCTTPHPSGGLPAASFGALLAGVVFRYAPLTMAGVFPGTPQQRRHGQLAAVWHPAARKCQVSHG